jgi:hypothetical protein
VGRTREPRLYPRRRRKDTERPGESRLGQALVALRLRALGQHALQTEDARHHLQLGSTPELHSRARDLQRFLRRSDRACRSVASCPGCQQRQSMGLHLEGDPGLQRLQPVPRLLDPFPGLLNVQRAVHAVEDRRGEYYLGRCQVSRLDEEPGASIAARRQGGPTGEGVAALKVHARFAGRLRQLYSRFGRLNVPAERFQLRPLGERLPHKTFERRRLAGKLTGDDLKKSVHRAAQEPVQICPRGKLTVPCLEQPRLRRSLVPFGVQDIDLRFQAALQQLASALTLTTVSYDSRTARAASSSAERRLLRAAASMASARSLGDPPTPN